MSSIKTYVFTDKKSGEVIFIKKSRHYDYTFNLPEVEVSVSRHPEALRHPEADTRHPEASRHPEAQPKDLTRTPSPHLLTKKKLEALIFLRTSECMMIDQVEKTLSVSDENTPYQSLIKAEKTLALDRIKNFFAEKHAQVAACQTVDSVAQFLTDMSNRVNLGVYSVMNQERKSLDNPFTDSRE